MPSFTTNTIKAAYNGEVTTCHYWAEGRGRRVEGYLTSLSQLKNKLRSRFRLPQLMLYCVAARHSFPITTDKHLLSALADLKSGGTLLLNVQKYESVSKRTHATPEPTTRQMAYVMNKTSSRNQTVTRAHKRTAPRTIRPSNAPRTATSNSNSNSSSTGATPRQVKFTVAMLAC